ncbi:MAG: aspartate--tRNA ligase [Candidatus Omnitrophota bacterium]|nr:aspartate--tRNA ligase [Candidatus Omnitrophota bacterium]
MLRTHTCGELTQKDINKEVTLCGWVAARRDHGKIIFIDIRDRYGLTQVVFLPKPDIATYEKAKALRSEDVIKVKGIVNPRPKNTENPKLATGFIEVLAGELEIINSSLDLPFAVDDSIDIGEETKLLHRYLDLRRKKSLEKIVLRHRFNQVIRGFLNAEGFLEVETPFLTKSTPEGARDFLVPSRLNPNKFYALPQSPQLFKQILMVAGLDKYYQIVRCFRDEDLRKDRQPEFTQLDIEMSFVDEEDIISLVERFVAYSFKEALGIEIKIPFLRISYKEAMQRYASDKPDFGGDGEYRFCWVMDFPLFEYNEEEKRWQACHHPFTSPKQEDIAFLDKDLAAVRARAYDLILNGQEIAGGSIRIHSPHLQEKIFSILGISSEDTQKKFGFLLRAFKYGAPVHGGIAFGLDRLYAIVTNSESIRDVIAFPKTQKGVCPLSEAPSFVEDKQLKEVYIKLVEEEKKE